MEYFSIVLIGHCFKVVIVLKTYLPDNIDLDISFQILRGYIHDLPVSQFDSNESEKDVQQSQAIEKEISDEIEKDQAELKDLKSKLDKTTNQLNETRKVSINF